MTTKITAYVIELLRKDGTSYTRRLFCTGYYLSLAIGNQWKTEVETSRTVTFFRPKDFNRFINKAKELSELVGRFKIIVLEETTRRESK